MIVRFLSHPWVALFSMLFAAVYFGAHLLPSWQKTERNSWRKICDSSSVHRNPQGFCYSCQGASHTFTEELYRQVNP